MYIVIYGKRIYQENIDQIIVPVKYRYVIIFLVDKGKKPEEPNTEKEAASSWSSWGSTVFDKGNNEGEEGDSRSAWSMPWGMDTSFTRQTKPNQEKSSRPTKETDTKTTDPKPAGLVTKSKKGALKLKPSSQSEKTDKEQEGNVISESKAGEQSERSSVVQGEVNESTVESENVLTERKQSEIPENTEVGEISEVDQEGEKVLDLVKSKEESIGSTDSKHSSFATLESESYVIESASSGVSDSGEKLTESELGELINQEKHSESPAEIVYSESIEILDTKRTEDLETHSVEGNDSAHSTQDQTQAHSVEGDDSGQDTLDNVQQAIDNVSVQSIQEEDKTEIQTESQKEGESVEYVEDECGLEENPSTDSCEKEFKNDNSSGDTEDVVENESRSQDEDIPSSGLDIDPDKLPGLPPSPSTASSLGGTDSDTNKLDSSLDAYTSDDTVVEKGNNKMSKSDESIPEDDNTENIPESSENQDDEISKRLEEVSPSSSYVKCMIEDAMDDSAKLEDNGSDTPSKSECSRSTGGHDSGDEISTTTSSDIEIISTPTSNGDGSRMVDLSPLKISLQKASRRGGSPTHRRSDSQSSSSTNSREGQFEQLSPGRDYQDDEDHRGSHSMQEGAKTIHL